MRSNICAEILGQDGGFIVALGRVLAGSLCTKVRIIISDEGMRIFLARLLDLCCVAFFLRRRALGLVAGRRIM